MGCQYLVLCSPHARCYFIHFSSFSSHLLLFINSRSVFFSFESDSLYFWAYPTRKNRTERSPIVFIVLIWVFVESELEDVIFALRNHSAYQPNRC